MVCEFETKPCMADTEGMVLSKVRISLRESFATLQFSKLKGTPPLLRYIREISLILSISYTHTQLTTYIFV